MNRRLNRLDPTSTGKQKRIGICSSVGSKPFSLRKGDRLCERNGIGTVVENRISFRIPVCRLVVREYYPFILPTWIFYLNLTTYSKTMDYSDSSKHQRSSEGKSRPPQGRKIRENVVCLHRRVRERQNLKRQGGFKDSNGQNFASTPPISLVYP